MKLVYKILCINLLAITTACSSGLTVFDSNNKSATLNVVNTTTNHPVGLILNNKNIGTVYSGDVLKIKTPPGEYFLKSQESSGFPVNFHLNTNEIINIKLTLSDLGYLFRIIPAEEFARITTK